MTKRPKKTPRQLAEKHADYWMSKFVRERDKRCIICGETNPAKLDAGHLIKRGKRGTRWHIDNVHCQCKACNYRHNNYPEVYTNWFLERYGMDAYAKLIELSRPTKFTTQEIREMGDRFRDNYNRLKGGYI